MRVKVRKNKIACFGERGRPRFYYHEALWRYAGQGVDVYYLASNLSALVVMHEGRFVCEAVNDEAMRYEASREAIKRLKHRQKEQRRAAKEWPEHHRTLYQTEQVLAELSAQVREKPDRKIHPLRPDLGPRPGTRAIPRAIPGFDQAAAARERQALPRAVNAPPPASRAIPDRDINSELLEDY